MGTYTEHLTYPCKPLASSTNATHQVHCNMLDAASDEEQGSESTEGWRRDRAARCPVQRVAVRHGAVDVEKDALERVERRQRRSPQRRLSPCSRESKFQRRFAFAPRVAHQGMSQAQARDRRCAVQGQPGSQGAKQRLIGADGARGAAWIAERYLLVLTPCWRGETSVQRCGEVAADEC